MNIVPEDTELNEEGVDSDSDLGSEYQPSEEQDSTQAEVPNWEAKFNEVSQHNKALNKRLVEYMRQANSQQKSAPVQQPQGQGQSGQGSGEYNTQVKIARAEIREGIERLLPLYPELPPETVNAIRRNPLAFVSEGFFNDLNTANALLDLEQHMMQEAEGSVDMESAPKAPNKQLPKVVRPSNQPQNLEEDVAEEEAADWTMPMQDLEKKIQKIRRRQN